MARSTVGGGSTAVSLSQWGPDQVIAIDRTIIGEGRSWWQRRGEEQKAGRNSRAAAMRILRAEAEPFCGNVGAIHFTKWRVRATMDVMALFRSSILA